MNGDEWSKYQKLVLSELQRLNKNLEELRNNQNRIHSDVELVKFKSGLYGAVAGVVSGAITILSGKWPH